VKQSRRPALDAGEGEPLEPRQARSIEKRARLCAAARDVFGARGYEGASVEEITSRAGVAVGAFYLHFRSKRQLLVALMNELLRRLDGLELTVPDQRDMRRALRTFLERALRADQENYGVIRAWNEAVSLDPAMAALNEAVHRWSHERVLGVFRQIGRHPSARRPRDLEIFAALIDRHLWTLLGRAATLSRADFDQEARVTADVIYRYLVRDAEG